METPLLDRHRSAGARLIPFAGYDMPVQYEGIRAEHVAVRTRAGVFDVSHMGEVETRGPQALALLQRTLSNDVSAIAVGGAQYSVMCREDGGVLDDLFTYRLGEDRYLTVTNAANHERDLAWIAGHAEGMDVEVLDRRDELAMLAVQGPQAREIVAGLTEGELPARFRTAQLRVAGADALVCGTGYTGEDGVELLVAAEDAERVWDAVVGAGVTPPGSERATRCASRPVTTSTATTSWRSAARSRPGWVVLQGGHGLRRGRGRRRRPRRRAGGAPGPVRHPRRRHRPAGQPDRGRRRRHQRHAVAVPRDRHRHGLRPGRSLRRR